ncbi:MAG: hypothetical protein H6744_10060 [Deltaproteobacteria bacterium]|nr:hypothetical protein [Deltaproteobacteria bacterium]
MIDSSSDASDDASPRPHSPLWMVMRQPLVEGLVRQLQETRQAILAAPDAPHTLHFSRSHLESVRQAYAAGIRQGEARLHRFCELLASRLFESSYDMQSVVVGELPSGRRRFTFSHPLAPALVYAETDLDLGTRVLSGMRLQDTDGFCTPQLVANFVEYQPHVEGSLGIHKMISRIKAEEEIWNKVVDEIFRLDELVARDKQLRELSHFVKDVFGVKIVVGSKRDVVALQDVVSALVFEHDELATREVPVTEETRTVRLVEVKDYLSEGDGKASGWEAMKSVLGWWQHTFELQIQPLANYFLERERLTAESHAGFKSRRESVRNSIASSQPLFGFYRDLLRWLFLNPEDPVPHAPGVRVEVSP